jgi:hypothetical protein
MREDEGRREGKRKEGKEGRGKQGIRGKEGWERGKESRIEAKR